MSTPRRCALLRRAVSLLRPSRRACERSVTNRRRRHRNTDVCELSAAADALRRGAHVTARSRRAGHRRALRAIRRAPRHACELRALRQPPRRFIDPSDRLGRSVDCYRNPPPARSTQRACSSSVARERDLHAAMPESSNVRRRLALCPLSFVCAPSQSQRDRHPLQRHAKRIRSHATAFRTSLSVVETARIASRHDGTMARHRQTSHS